MNLLSEQLKTWIPSEAGTANKTAVLCMRIWEASQVRKSNNLFTFTIMRLSINLAPSRIQPTKQHRSHVREEMPFKASLFAPFMNIQAVFFLLSVHGIICAHLSRRFIVERSEHTSQGVGHDVGYEVSTRSGKYKSRQTLAHFYLFQQIEISRHGCEWSSDSLEPRRTSFFSSWSGTTDWMTKSWNSISKIFSDLIKVCLRISYGCSCHKRHWLPHLLLNLIRTFNRENPKLYNRRQIHNLTTFCPYDIAFTVVHAMSHSREGKNLAFLVCAMKTKHFLAQKVNNMQISPEWEERNKLWHHRVIVWFLNRCSNQIIVSIT